MEFIKLTARNGLEVVVRKSCIKVITSACTFTTIFLNGDNNDFVEVRESVPEIFKMLKE